MSVSAVIQSICTVTEVIEVNDESMSTAGATVEHNQFNEAETIAVGTTPPATMCAHFVQALGAGAATIDLNALTGTNGATVDGEGLKVQYLRMKNLGANAMTLTFGAANPYNLMGATFLVILNQNQWFDFFGNDSTPDITGGVADEMDLAGTGAQTAEFTIVLG